jgi:hypothetical protein
MDRLTDRGMVRQTDRQWDGLTHRQGWIDRQTKGWKD